MTEKTALKTAMLALKSCPFAGHKTSAPGPLLARPPGVAHPRFKLMQGVMQESPKHL